MVAENWDVNILNTLVYTVPLENVSRISHLSCFWWTFSGYSIHNKNQSFYFIHFLKLLNMLHSRRQSIPFWPNAKINKVFLYTYQVFRLQAFTKKNYYYYLINNSKIVLRRCWQSSPRSMLRFTRPASSTL